MKTPSLLSNIFILLMISAGQQISAQAPDWAWAKTFGSAVPMYDERGESVAVDASGNVYTVGEFTGTVDFDQGAGTTNITTYGGFDVFISKLDPAGNFIWAKRLGGAGDDEGFAVTVDPTGNYIYIAGSFGGTADFDPGANSFNLASGGSLDVFVCKLDVSGNFVWAKQMEGSSGNYGYATGIVTDNSGNVYTAGYFSGTVDFDPGNGVVHQSSSTSDVFISKLDGSGNYVWARQFVGPGDDRAYSICLDHSGSGDIYTTGFFANTVDFDPGNGTANLTAVGQRDIFISRLDPSGNFVWAKAMGGTSSEWGNEVTLDVAGNVCLTGGFYGTTDFDPGANFYNLTSAGLDDIFIARLTPNGNFLGATSAGGPSWDEGFSITADSMGNIFTTGFFSGTVDFNPDSTMSTNLTSIGDSDVFVTRMDAAGHLVWATSAGGTKGETGLSIAVYYDGDAYVSGFYRSSNVTFSANTIDNADVGGSLVSDAFVAKLDHVTGIENPSGKNLVIIYPNPANDKFVIKNMKSGINIISIFNMLGDKMFSISTLEEKTIIDSKHLSPGVYFVKVENEKGSDLRKLIVE